MEMEDSVKFTCPSPAPALYTAEVGEMFEKAKQYLDTRRDKDEEICRLSKDITWESKRIIYVLHRFFVYDSACNDARRRIKTLLSTDRYFLGLAKALEGQDMSLHYRRYTNCVQEYIEAVVFLHFLEHRRIPTYEEVKSSLVWDITEKFPSTPHREGDEENSNSNSAMDVDVITVKRTLTVPLSVGDYVLGICDFTGELMKAAIPTLTKPKWHTFLVQAFALVREIYAQLVGIYAQNREFRKKLSVMRASVMKIETTVYRLKIKVLIYGGRIPDSTELKMIEKSADSGYNNTCDNSGRFGGNNNGNGQDGGNGRTNDDEFPGDSGVE